MFVKERVKMFDFRLRVVNFLLTLIIPVIYLIPTYR